jgi:hypothetical protein
VGILIALTNSVESRPEKDVKTIVQSDFSYASPSEILKSKIETKHCKDFLCVNNNKTTLKIDIFVDFTLKRSSEQNLACIGKKSDCIKSLNYCLSEKKWQSGLEISKIPMIS